MKASAGKVLMVVENPFPQDHRVRNEAVKLASAGYKVSVIAKRYPEQKNVDTLSDIKIYRVPWFQVFKKSTESHSRFVSTLYNIGTKLGYIIEYFYYTFAVFFYSIYVLVKDGFDAIHIHNPPDTLFIVGLFHRIIGKKFVFDHHDLSPELFLSRYNSKGGLIYKALLLEEKLCLRSANLVIATNESYKAIDIKRGNKKPENIFIVRNGPDLDRFKNVDPDPELKAMGKTILIYIGIMGPQDGVDYLLRSLYLMVNKFNRKDFYCVIVGYGDSLEDLKNLRIELKLEEYCRFTEEIPFKDLLRYLSTADIGIDPNPSNPLNDHSTWIKVMEYMSMSKPMVCFDLKETHYSAQEAALYVQPNNEEDYAKAIITLIDNPELRKKMGEYGRQRIINELSWDKVSEKLLNAYKYLLPNKIPTNLKVSKDS
jgi:glycosyltransferase involved in cell wall biosynthesis